MLGSVVELGCRYPLSLAELKEKGSPRSTVADLSPLAAITPKSFFVEPLTLQPSNHDTACLI